MSSGLFSSLHLPQHVMTSSTAPFMGTSSSLNCCSWLTHMLTHITLSPWRGYSVHAKNYMNGTRHPVIPSVRLWKAENTPLRMEKLLKQEQVHGWLYVSACFPEAISEVTNRRQKDERKRWGRSDRRRIRELIRENQYHCFVFVLNNIHLQKVEKW